MRRRLLNLLTALSLLLCVAVCALWVRSHFVSDLFIADGPGAGAFLWTAPAIFRFQYSRDVDEGFPRKPHKVGIRHEVREPAPFERLPGEPIVNRHGFALVTGERWGQYNYAVYLPGWSMLVLAIVLPVIRATLVFRRQTPGLCPRCGYDLRATLDRCPECGTENPATISN